MKEAIFIKRIINDNIKLRGRFGIYFDDGKNWPTRIPRTDTIFGHSPRIYFSSGFERKIFSHSKININAGIDAFVFYNRDKTRQNIKTLSIPQTDIERFRDDIEVKTGLLAFVNVEYMISNHFALNIESFWQFAYRRERYFHQEYSSGRLTSGGGRTINRFITQIQPISSINLIYKF